MSQNYYVAIMAGGIGSRFWPASRESTPKQFLDITDCGSSLIQQTVARLTDLIPQEHILIVSNSIYADLILEQLPMIKRSQLLLEPSRNNTAPCVAYTALHLNAINPDAVFAMLPADQVIKKEDEFLKAMTKGFARAEKDNAIVTLGINPTRPDTGYGYIDYNAEENDNGIFKVNSFKEKPSVETAKKYLEKGGYVWNAGIFIWSSKTILKAFRQSANQILQVLAQDTSKYGTKEEQAYIDEVYPQTQSISVDYAILEQASNVFTIPVDIGWSDLGTWNSLYAFLDKDKYDNVTLAKNTAISDSTGNLIRLGDKEKLIVIKGLHDFIVIDEGDVLLIYPRGKEQEIKQIRSSLKDKRFA